MSELKWYAWKEKDQENPFVVFITELENGMLIILSDKGARIGTIALGIPSPLVKGRSSTSSMPIVFGIRNELLSRAISERIAQRCEKIVIASVYMTEDSTKFAQRALQCAEKAIQDYLTKKE